MDSTSDLSNQSSTTETNNSPKKSFDDKDMKELPSKRNVPYILNGTLFEILAQDGENVTVKCCHCPPDRVYRGSVRSTGNFHMHIKRRHPELLAKLNEMKITALLDRRQCLGKVRKVGATKGRKHKSILKIKIDKTDEKQSSSPQSPTVDLKIKTVFQRHQQQAEQQQREEALKNCGEEAIADFAIPTKEQSEPLDFSIKSADENVEMQEQALPMNLANINEEKTTSHVPQERPNFGTTSGTPEFYASQPQAIQSQRTGNDIVVLNDCNVQPQSLPYFKQESLILNQPLDLTFQSSLRPSVCTPTTDVSSGHNFVCTHSIACMASSPFENAMKQLNEILIDMQREMILRNQIELNRIIFDVAKFKYIYPDFSYP